MKKLFCVIVTVIVVVSCSDVKKLYSGEYLGYVLEHESEFNVAQTSGGITFNVQYTPLDELIAQEMEDNDSPDLENLKKLREDEKKSPSTLLQLCVEVPSGTLFTQHKEDHSVQMKYYAVEFKKEIRAVTTSNDTIACQNYIFQSNAGFGTRSYFEFQFPGGIETIQQILVHSQYLTDSIIAIDIASLKHPYPKVIIK